MVLILLGVLVIWFLVRSYNKSKTWMNGFDLHNDMFNKYVELSKDPRITDIEWKKWLPIFEESDKICDRDCPDMKFDPTSLKIRRIINKEESTQD